MHYDKAFLEKTLSAKGVDVKEVNLDHIEMITANLEKVEEHLNDFSDLHAQIPITIVDKEELKE